MLRTAGVGMVIAAALAAPAAAATGVLVPLYVEPGPAWSTVESVARHYPSVPIVAIVNPNNGPGSHRSQAYVAGVAALHAAGVTVLGYVYTSYGKRNAAVEKAQILSYRRWYGVDGIFLDEMADVRGFEGYYSALHAFVNANGMHVTVGNPGTNIPTSYVGTVDTLVIYENPGYPTLAYLEAYQNFAASNFAFIAYHVATLDPAFDRAAATYVGEEYVTNLGGGNPYRGLPSYFADLVSTLAGV